MAVSSVRVVEWLKWLLVTVVTPLVVLWKLVRLRIHQVHLVEKIGGPRAYPLIGNILGPKTLSARDVYLYLSDLSNLYGKTFRLYIGPQPFVCILEKKDLQIILSGQKYTEKKYLYKYIRLVLGKGLLVADGEGWRQRRKLLSPAFHFKTLEQFVPVFNSCGDEFVRQLRRHANGNAFNVYPLVELLMLDVICETAMGVALKAQTKSYSSFVNATEQVMKITAARVFKLWQFFDFIFKITPTGREFMKNLKIIRELTDKLIRERRAELELIKDENTLDVDEIGRRRRLGFLDMLLLLARGGTFTDADIREEVHAFMIAGRDTTGVAVAYTIFLLSRHKDAQEKILSELESVFDPLQPLQPSLQQLSELKYLEMVVKESLRLYPPAPVFNRYNPEDTRLDSGHVIPEGCSIAISPFCIHRDPEVFPEPERFIPERFSPEESARRHPYAYIPFSAGPRNCIGQRFAILALKTVVAKVVWNFRILPAPDFEPELLWDILLTSRNGILVRLEERRAN